MPIDNIDTGGDFTAIDLSPIVKLPPVFPVNDLTTVIVPNMKPIDNIITSDNSGGGSSDDGIVLQPVGDTVLVVPTNTNTSTGTQNNNQTGTQTNIQTAANPFVNIQQQIEAHPVIVIGALALLAYLFFSKD